MRKDVKLGFAIGGVLFSVLIVYVLVISGGSNDAKPEQVTLVTKDAPAKTDKTPAPAAQQDKPRQRSTQRQANGSETPAKGADAKDAKTEKTENAPTDPFKQTAAAPATKPGNSASTADQWAAALQGGAPPTLLNTTTPTAAPTTRAAQAAASESAAPTPVGAANTPSQTKPIMALTGSNTPATIVPQSAQPLRVSNPSSAAPTTRSGNSLLSEPQQRTAAVATPPSAGGRTHVVQTGETFSSIAAAAYGNAAYYSHIIRANPTLDPKKLRAGMTINLPAESEVKANNTAAPAAAVMGSATPAPAAAVKIDEKTEYRVESGDNLNKISSKLYGKADRWEKIYEANKALIGADPKNLKVGMVLKLPEAPSLKPQ